MTRVEKAAAASFTLMVWTREKACVACGEPGANAHHILYGQGRREDVLANGTMLCGSGTTGCHGRFHAGDPVVARLIGEHIRDNRPDTMSYLALKLGGEEGARNYLRRRYRMEGEMEPQAGRVDAAKVELYQDEKGEYRWRAKDTNGEIVADSGDDGYVERSYAEKAATDLFPNAEIVREWE